jgi:hypothetical protein
MGEQGPPLNCIEHDAFLKCSGVPCNSQGFSMESVGGAQPRRLAGAELVGVHVRKKYLRSGKSKEADSASAGDPWP